MSDPGSLRPGVRESYRVSRRIRLDPSSWQQFDATRPVLEAELELLLGFDRLQSSPPFVQLSYDAGYLQLDCVLELLQRFKLQPEVGRWQRMRLSWYRFQDGNIRDNSRDTSSSCCSQSPLRHR